MEDPSDKSKQPKPNPQKVSRRSIIRSGSEVRHGRVYEEQVDHSVRAMTPDIEPSTIFIEGGTKDTFQTSPMSSSMHRSQGSLSGKETSAPPSVMDEESAAESRRRPSQRRTRTKDDLISDASASPSSLLSKTRRRLGSITTGGAGISKSDMNHGSIGYPSVGHTTGLSGLPDVSSSRPSSTPRRTVSSDASLGPGSIASHSPMFLNTDASKILQLMKTTCGRMHGILFFRSLGTSMWDSGYCAINVTPGSLVCQKQGEVAATKTLVPDLRGCTVRTHFDLETTSTYISVMMPQSGFGVQLRPPIPETFDSWLAALLCWQPLRPSGLQSKLPKQHSLSGGDRRPTSQRRTSDFPASNSNAIVKVGRMVLLDGPLPAGSQRHLSRRSADIDFLQENGPWRRVSCTLHENGTFKLLTEKEAKTICVVRLSQLTRCAVQRLHESVLDAPYCLAIYPQYTIQNSFSRRSQPLVLGLESEAAFEAWFVLLRALTIPELYGPEARLSEFRGDKSLEESGHNSDMFRIERSLTLKITEAKLDLYRVSDFALVSQTNRTRQGHGEPLSLDVYTDICFGRDLMARTAMKSCSTFAFWAEEFFMPDIPSMLSTLAVKVKIGNPGEREWTMIAHNEYDLASADPNSLSGMSGLEIASHDPDFGSVEVLVDDVDGEKGIEKWWPLVDKNGQNVGQILLKINLAETVVLMDAEYKVLSDLLHRFDNSITTQIGHVLAQELKPLSEILLDIFQASNTVQDWIGALIDEEIDGIYKETPPVRMRFSGRIHSNDSYESAEKRELLVRDLSRSATMEANLLFRGNSLVTKALDAHMRRLGKAYLEETLADKLRHIALHGPECEVNPNKVHSRDHLQRNWSALNSLTKEIWHAISTSASKCPVSLRLIFKHIRSCAEDRYGSFIRTVKYTSVSGFLFLRFFCPAILNPKMFGLLEEIPSERARRTFTLLAKSLNVLANMSKFGTKEPWMEPMNKFLFSATPSFKKFIEDICSVSLSQSAVLEAQYLAPNQIRARLPAMSREGLPSLPFLIDSSRSFALLVDLWMNNVPANLLETSVDDSVRNFHQICSSLHRKTKASMAVAEPAEKPDRHYEPQWQRILIERQKPKRSVSGNHVVDDSFAGLSLDQEITALPQHGEQKRGQSHHKFEFYDQNNGGDTTASSSTSITEQRHIPYSSLHPGLNPVMSSSNNSSTISLDASDDPRDRALPASRDGSSRARFLDLVTSSSRKKGKISREQERNEF